MKPKSKPKKNNVIRINEKNNQTSRLRFSITEILDEETGRGSVKAFDAFSALEDLTNGAITGSLIDEDQANTLNAAAQICMDMYHDLYEYREAMGWNKKAKEA